MASIQATRLRKGMLIKMGADLFKIIDLHHLTPGNKRGMVQARLRNIRSQALTDHKFRSEDDVERATLAAEHVQQGVDLLVAQDLVHVVRPCVTA